MGKGGSTTQVEIPQYIEDAAKANLARADIISKLGYVPQSFGATTAAFTPMQMSAFGNTAQAADAFGLGTPAGADIYGGMGAPTEYANGIRAYSAAPLFNQSMADFAYNRPDQFAAINDMFIDPGSPPFALPPGVVPGLPGGNPGGGGNPGNPGNGGGNGGGSGGGGGGGGGGGIIPPVVIPPGGPGGPPEVPVIPYTPPEFQPGFIPGIFGPDPTPPIVPIGDAQPGDAIAETDLDALNANLIGTGFEIPDVPGQKYQFYNPDINYFDDYGRPAYISPSTGQFVGTLEPSAEGLEAAQIGQEYLRSQSGAEGLAPMADDFYDGIRSASDFSVGLSTQGYDFSTYADPSKQGRNNTFTNDFGSSVSVGYGAGQVDPALAAAAGYTNPEPGVLSSIFGSATPEAQARLADEIAARTASTENSAQRRASELNSAIETFGGQALLDEGTNLAGDQIMALERQFGTLTTTEVAEQAGLAGKGIPTGKGNVKATRKVLDKAARDGNLGAYADSFMEKFGGNLNTFQEKTGISSAILEDIKKIAAAKVTT